MHHRITSEILKPLLKSLKGKGIRYRGLIYVGLMITATGPKVLEFNVRFGDPECQAILMRLKSDLVALLVASITGNLHRIQLEWYEDDAVCVVLCAKGYPGTFDKGNPIYGLDTLRDWQDGFVFHAGTTKVDGRWITTGGRVLGVTARGRGIGSAVQKAYDAINRITWDGMHYRRDIAHRALK